MRLKLWLIQYIFASFFQKQDINEWQIYLDNDYSEFVKYIQFWNKDNIDNIINKYKKTSSVDCFIHAVLQSALLEMTYNIHNSIDINKKQIVSDYIYIARGCNLNSNIIYGILIDFVKNAI